MHYPHRSTTLTAQPCVRFAASPTVYLSFADAPKRSLLKAKRLVASDESKMRSRSYWLETARSSDHFPR